MLKLQQTAWYLLIAVGMLCVSNLAFADEGGELSTLFILQSTLSAIPNCLHYKIIGTCYWLDCNGPVCTTQTTLKVDHYLPDAVVSVYRKPTSNPWDYAKNMVDPIADQAGETEIRSQLHTDLGYGNENDSSPENVDNHFKEADVIGNPALMLFKKYQQMLIPSVAKPFMPYYLSLADAYLWRSPMIESVLYAYALVPGVHIVGSLIDNWGSIYPRTGFLDQPADGKAAAVIAQRAASIATQSNQPHVYQSLPSGSCGADCKVSEAKENSPESQWQMIYPIADNQCTVFGSNDLAQSKPWGSDAAQQGNGNYTWILWRHYHGCIPHQGKFLGSVNF